MLAPPAAAWQKQPASQPPTVGQQILELRRLSDQIAQALRNRDDQTAAAKLIEAERLMAKISDRGNSLVLKRALAPLQRRLRGVRRGLQRRGAIPKSAPTTGENESASQVGFVRDVAPLLVANCRGCHIDRASGGFSMQTFETLLRGSRKGTVIVPGMRRRSRLFVLLANGEMPRDGDPLPKDALETIGRWIDSGARFDGPNPSTPLVELAAADRPMPDSPAMPKLTRPKGGETISFRRDVAPVLVEHCIECHGPRRPSARLNLSQFTGLLRGGDNGPILMPGKPEESLLIQKLRGKRGRRMPLRKPPLNEQQIARIATWIAEGATFDGDQAPQPLQQLVQIDRVRAMNADELASFRAERALARWRLAVPDTAPHQAGSEHFLLIGDLPVDALSELAELAEDELARLRSWLAMPADQTPFPGRLPILVFRHTFDYTEFGKMVEDREIPSDWPGHWNVEPLDTYACLPITPEMLASDDAALRGTLGEVIAGVYLAQRGAPAWFAQAVAAALREKLHPKDPRVVTRRQHRLAPLPSNASLLARGLAMDDVALARYSLGNLLLSSAPRFRRLMVSLHKGQDFNAALANAYGREAAPIADLWRRQQTTTNPRRRR